jgi:anaerobic selenocysteine-containing dehydrogenase
VIARLAQRFDVELSPYPALVFDELSAICYGGIPFGEVGEQASLRPRVPSSAVPGSDPGTRPAETEGPGLRLVTYRPLFSGPAVERVPELQFQRPGPEVELSRVDAKQLGITEGQPVTVSSNGTSLELRARLSGELSPGVARIPVEHAAGLEGRVEVAP